MKDIHGLGYISWWPIAPGWWLLIAMVIFFSFAFYLLYQFLLERRRKIAWKIEAENILWKLEKDNNKPIKDKVVSVSILLRKLAMRRFGRSSCARLEGKDWLRWLTQNDPAGFNWEREGQLLIIAPYAPDIAPELAVDFEKILKATHQWVK